MLNDIQEEYVFVYLVVMFDVVCNCIIAFDSVNVRSKLRS